MSIGAIAGGPDESELTWHEHARRYAMANPEEFKGMLRRMGIEERILEEQRVSRELVDQVVMRHASLQGASDTNGTEQERKQVPNAAPIPWWAETLDLSVQDFMRACGFPKSMTGSQVPALLVYKKLGPSFLENLWNRGLVYHPPALTDGDEIQVNQTSLLPAPKVADALTWHTIAGWERERLENIALAHSVPKSAIPAMVLSALFGTAFGRHLKNRGYYYDPTNTHDAEPVPEEKRTDDTEEMGDQSVAPSQELVPALGEGKTLEAVPLEASVDMWHQLSGFGVKKLRNLATKNGWNPDMISAHDLYTALGKNLLRRFEEHGCVYTPTIQPKSITANTPKYTPQPIEVAEPSMPSDAASPQPITNIETVEPEALAPPSPPLPRVEAAPPPLLRTTKVRKLRQRKQSAQPKPVSVHNTTTQNVHVDKKEPVKKVAPPISPKKPKLKHIPEEATVSKWFALGILQTDLEVERAWAACGDSLPCPLSTVINIVGGLEAFNARIGEMGHAPINVSTKKLVPTNVVAGSNEKIAIIQGRLAAGLDLWHKRDRTDYEDMGSRLPRLFRREKDEESDPDLE